MPEALILDFDGTLVTEDLLDIACKLVGKEKESAQLNADFHAGKISGLTPLITRINFLQGLTLSKLYEELTKSTYLMPGATQLCEFARAQNFITIIVSGNI